MLVRSMSDLGPVIYAQYAGYRGGSRGAVASHRRRLSAGWAGSTRRRIPLYFFTRSSFAVMGCSMLALLLLISQCSAWELVVTPNGDRLLDQRTGGNFIVSCKVKDYDGAASDVKVEWYKNGELASHIGNIMAIYKTYGNQLLINSPKISDGGAYTCKADVSGQLHETTVLITFADPPKFIDPETEQHPEEGSNAEIVCNVEGTEKLEVFWQFNGSILEEGSPRGYEFRNDRQVLIIPAFDSKKDDGIYNCNAAQFSSFETLAINVTGYSRPLITVFDTPSNGVGIEGDSAKLQCGAVGKPKPLYEWFDKNDEAIVNSDKYKVEDGLLIIESLSENDAGEYKCVASNPVGNASRVTELKIKLRPRIEKLLDLTRKEGESAEVVCRYSGDGVTAAKFVFGSEEYSVVSGNEVDLVNEVDSSERHEISFGDEDDEEKEEIARIKRFEEDITSERIRVRAEENAVILHIRNLSLADAGLYKCAVSNRAGWTERAFHIAIIHPPVFRRASDDITRSFDGNTVNIFCEVSAVPDPLWTWQRDGNEFEADGSSIIIDNNGGVTKLILQNKNGQNYGKYTCKADNGFGTFTKSTDVIRIITPVVPEGIDCKKRLYPNYGKCSVDNDLYYDEASRPTRIEFQVLENMDYVKDDLDWDHAPVISVLFDGTEMVVRNLTPNTQYSVRVRAVNEAGASDFSQPAQMETTDPWAPKKPVDLRMDCAEMCTVYWEESNNHGSAIIAYRITVQEFTENEHGEKQNVGNAFVVEVDGEKRSHKLTHIRPHTSYRISVAAINAVGAGEVEEVEVDTDDSPMVPTELLMVHKLAVIVGIALFVILFVIDFICYVTNTCGLIACFCINCLGRAPRDRKGDVESGR
ncbi:unnamed protein product [Angiostrongylus costaricensis]|uniref:Protein amalgam n=1 Tax=Angiostrongylus costaricensis TaxID=334426 RepID=A0A0R3PNG2_ANGCS|nr:unnamed protein product [Angiostrongylus costaricensis]